MKLEVGEFYLSASGEVIEIIIKRSNMFEDVYLNSFFEDGICNGDIRDFDLIAHIPKELHKMICELVNNYHSNNEAIKQLEELENKSCSNCKHYKQSSHHVYKTCFLIKTNGFNLESNIDFYCNKWENKE